MPVATKKASNNLRGTMPPADKMQNTINFSFEQKPLEVSQSWSLTVGALATETCFEGWTNSRSNNSGGLGKRENRKIRDFTLETTMIEGSSFPGGDVIVTHSGNFFR